MGDTKLIGAAQASELATALRQVSDEVADVVHAELEDLARGIARDAAKLVPHRTGRAQASYRARGAAVTFGGPDAPYVPWLEFGGNVGRKNSAGKGTVPRNFVKRGRYLYPVLARDLKDIEKRVDQLISDMTNGYLEVD